jgi:3-oxoacyl-[acyl-carrier-protein] synthase-3
VLYIHGIGHFHPENEIDNAFLEALDIGTDDEWIMERVGIRSRRTVLDLGYIQKTYNRDPRGAAEASVYTNAQTAAQAARMALDRAGLRAEDIGMVISGSCSPQWTAPAEAATVAAELNIAGLCIDVSSACSTFAAQLSYLKNASVGSLPDYVLITQPENTTRAVDYSDRRGAVIWGDASTAAVVSNIHSGRAKVTYTCLHSDPSGWEKVRIRTGGLFEQDGRAVQKFAIREGAAALVELVEHAKGAPERVGFVGHQANLLVLEGICRRADVDTSRHLHNVTDFGNCGAAGAPSVLSQRWDSFESGYEVALAVVGAGLTWGGALIEFE